MYRCIGSLSYLFLFTLSCLLNNALPAYAYNFRASSQPHALADFPTVDANYIYDQLFYMATTFQHREAGYDNNLPLKSNGHDEYAAYWSQEMFKNLQGFGAQVRRDEFPIAGWLGRPAVVPAFNLEVSVPGVTHPEQVVVIGCHYDGEAISTQSANDDASGCAIELGVAKAMGEYWRKHHSYPARTLRFVIFDAEEQGIYGSFQYLNNTINGDVNNIVAMFNEEQNGIAYPLRYLGKLSNPLLPFYIDMSPLLNSQLYQHQDELSQRQKNNITHFRNLMQQAIPAVFAQFQALGFESLSYHGDNNQDVSQHIFTPDQMGNVKPENDTLGGSDQIPFTLAGLPCATFAGNSTYYSDNPPPWSYPYDQKQDTIQLMNTFASGSSQKAQALVLALALPGMLTTWMLNQPDILGQARANTTPIATISDIGQTVVKQKIALDAKASFEPNNSSSNLSYAWNFGDGSKASGISVNHIYTTAGIYTLTLTVNSAQGTRHISKQINVVTQATNYNNPYASFQPDGVPQPNVAVTLPMPNDNSQGKTPLTPATGDQGALNSVFVVIGIFIGMIVLVVIIRVMLHRREQKRGI
ncbi:MAG: hypothetical protein NVS4B7_11920 [Ktedonobacteraceae bacterium]